MKCNALVWTRLLGFLCLVLATQANAGPRINGVAKDYCQCTEPLNTFMFDFQRLTQEAHGMGDVDEMQAHIHALKDKKTELVAEQKQCLAQLGAKYPKHWSDEVLLKKVLLAADKRCPSWAKSFSSSKALKK